jgi:hypothetical protein
MDDRENAKPGTLRLSKELDQWAPSFVDPVRQPALAPTCRSQRRLANALASAFSE